MQLENIQTAKADAVAFLDAMDALDERIGKDGKGGSASGTKQSSALRKISATLSKSLVKMRQP